MTSCVIAGVSIEMSLAKDQSLTVVITGKLDCVMRARKMVVQQLQTQVRGHSHRNNLPGELSMWSWRRGGFAITQMEVARIPAVVYYEKRFEKKI